MRPDQFWAKLRGGEAGAWHPLVAHSADVAAVATRLLQPDSTISVRLSRLLGQPAVPRSLRSLLVLLAGIHDIGKTNQGFQARRHPQGSRRFGHEGHVQIVLQSLEYTPFVSTVQGLFEPWVPPGANLVPAFAAGIAHHGRPFDLERGRGGLEPLWGTDSVSGRDPLAEIRRLGRHLRSWSEIEESGPVDALPEAPAFTHLFAGLVTLADWIGSTEGVFPFWPSADEDPDRYWQEEALPRADRACREIGVVPSRAVASPKGSTELYRRMVPTVFGTETGNRPTELQVQAATMTIPPPGSRVLIEAATGSGKTEAALALYARLRAGGSVGGLMFALPTRATASAMQGRVSAALKGIYGRDVPGVTLAVGGSGPRMVPADAVAGAPQHLYDEDEGVTQASLAAWASGHGKKFLSAEIVVGTVDQALLAALAVKHAHLRLAGLCRHLLVVDEVHSHDRYMLQVLRTLLDFHGDAGGHAVLMSATLSAEARARLGGGDTTEASFREDVRRPYPTLAVRKSGDVWRDHAVDENGSSRTVAWQATQETQGVGEAVEAARAGARVCILRNLVKDAQKTVRRIQESGDGSLLWRPPGGTDTPPYHAKYAGPDRRLLDDAVLQRFGKTGPDRGGSILVATQVVEQSLDVDFDFLVTDLAPVEVLLQRIGRLHRHPGRTERGARPVGYEAPDARILVPGRPFSPTPRFHGPHGWGTVYREQPILELTRRLIEDRPTITIPVESRQLMETVYHPTQLEGLRREEGWSPVLDEMEGVALSETLHASDCVLEFERTYHENAVRFRDESSIRTRIGDDTVRVELDPPLDCWYATGARETHVDRRIQEVERAGLEVSNPRIGPGRTRNDGVTEYPMGDDLLLYSHVGWIYERSR